MDIAANDRGHAGWLFAYGSVATEVAGDGEVAELRHHVRAWTVAMDNRRTVPGYKFFTLHGRRPACHVAFLTVVPQPGAAVNGVAVPVTAAGLAGLDARERNYDRVDVTGLLDPALPGPVYAYAASRDGRRRFDRARTAGDGAVQRAYVEGVEAGFAAMGGDALVRFRDSTATPPFPVLPLERHDVPHHLA